jgi:hypothetical protein
VFGLTKRLITRLNATGDTNVQSLHIAKLVSAYHSASNPLNVVASFRNAGISARLNSDGDPVGYVDVDQCRCLLHSFTMADLAAFESSIQPRPEVDEAGSAEDLASLPFWIQVLEEETSHLDDSS